ncbi:DUF6036 family nucleotidyltransferase [Rhodopirellula europaea]|uniref:DUF6036 family nucleotidyltransferase n=1 Tax=Rhodopirellula europaea TaxID=1263866 RepID=UPI003D2A1E5E
MGSPFRFELFRLTDQPFDQVRFERRQKVTIAGDEVWIPTPEDVILQKLIWSRPQDKNDVLGVIAVNYQELDQRYLQEWAKKLGLVEEFANAWALAIESVK